jgi:hypothetical protein
MIEIIDKLDEWVSEEYSGLNKKLWGYCELVHKTTGTPPVDQPMPVKIIDGVADRGTNQVSLDDKFELITWGRLPGTVTAIANEEDNWGLKDGRRQSFTLRWIVAHKVQLGENFINTLLRSLPDRLTIDGYEFVYINPDIEVDADHEAIYRTELGNTVYERHRFNWNIYSVSLTFEFIMCEVSE